MNYTGPFFNFYLPGGITLFKDAEHPFSFKDGPFGVSFSAANFPPGRNFTLGAGITAYKDKFHFSFKGPAGMVAATFTAELIAMMGIAFMEGNPAGMMTSVGSLSWTLTILVTKEVWNKRRPKWNMEARRIIKERPDGYSSGAARWRAY